MKNRVIRSANGRVELSNFPYKNQLDNKFRPFATCNVTSIAMCLWYFGIRGDGSFPQLEDQVYQRAIKNGWNIHSPQDMVKIAQSYPGVIDNFTERGTVKMIQNAIDEGLPCIIHGYFTRSGHIIVVKGYDNIGFIVNDPYGEYFHPPKGYDLNTVTKPNKGEGLRYSYNGIIQPLCSPESNPARHIWTHIINRRI